MNYEENNKRLLELFRKEGRCDYLDEMYQNNKKLFYKICSKFRNEEMDDLMQECYFALVKAANSYSDAEGTFGNYLTNITVWYLIGYSKNNNTVRIPEYMKSMIQKYLDLKSDPSITDKAICRIMKISIDNLEDIKKALLVNDLASLDSPLEYDEDLSLHDVVADLGAEVEDIAVDSAFNDELTKAINEALKELSPVEKNCIECRYYKDMTYKEIDPDHSEQNTRNKIERALLKLRKNTKLHDFYEEENLFVGTGINYFRNHQQSSVERLVLRKLEVEEG